MNDPYYQELARKFLDLWQDQLGKQMTQPQFMDSLLNVMQNMDPVEPVQPRKPKEPSHDPQDTSAAHATEPGLDALGKLERRLIICENRIAMLESRLRQLGGDDAKRKPAAKPDGKPARRVSAARKRS